MLYILLLLLLGLLHFAVFPTFTGDCFYNLLTVPFLQKYRFEEVAVLYEGLKGIADITTHSTKEFMIQKQVHNIAVRTVDSKQDTGIINIQQEYPHVRLSGAR